MSKRPKDAADHVRGRFLLMAAVATVLLGLAVTSVAAPGDTVVASAIDGSSDQARAGGCGPNGKPHECISADGRFVVFESESPDLVAEDTNGVSDVFVRDRSLQRTTRVSKGPGGVQASQPSGSPAISADGRFVAYESRAHNLVAGDTNGAADVFVSDVVTGVTERVNLTDQGMEATGWIPGDLPTISGDGRYVAFCSRSQLVPSDTNDDEDVYVRDRQARTTRRVSVGLDGSSGSGFIPTISTDGRFVAFSSESPNLVPGDTNNMADVFVRDLQTGLTDRVSVGPDGSQGWGYQSSISADGRYVAFWTTAAFDSADTNAKYDIYVRDRVLGTTRRATVAANGGSANQNSFEPAISANGRYVAFTSDASNIVPGDTNRVRDVFVRDLWTATTERASIASSGAEGNNASLWVSMSSEKLILLGSLATNLVEGTSGAVYLHELGGPKIQAYTLDPTSHALGSQTVTTRRNATVVIKNSGTVPIWVGSVALSGTDASQFSVVSPCRGWLQPVATCNVVLRFAPTSLGPKLASLQVTAASGVRQSVALTGTGVKAAFTLTPASLSFGEVTVGSTSVSRTIVVGNTGAGVLPIKAIYLEGADRTQFRRQSDCPTIVAISGSCTVNVRLAPTAPGLKQARLMVWGGGWAGAKFVALAGSGR